MFLNKITQAYDKAFPLVKKKNRREKYKPWITKGFKKSIPTKNKLYKYYLNILTVFNETNYKKYKNKLNKLISIAERYHYHKEFQKHRGNLQKTWQLLKDVIGKKTVSLCHREFLVDDKIIQDKKLIADKFNVYFTNIGPEFAKGIPEVTERPEDYICRTFKNSMFLAPVTTEEIKGIIEK